MKKDSRQVNVQMSNDVADVLDKISNATGLPKVAILELCVTEYASTLPKIKQEAEQAFVRVLTKNLGKSVGK